MSGEGKNKKVEGVKCDEDQSQKRKLDVDDAETETVKSANEWEHVDLGDDSRKNKFLRLMGASKKEHHGKIIIGDKKPAHGRSKEDTEKLSEDLEEQYKQGLEMKLSGHTRKHVGLGFQDDDDDDDDFVDRRPRRNSNRRTEEDNGDGRKVDRRDDEKKKKFKSEDTDNRGEDDVKHEGTDDKSEHKKQREEKKFGLFVKSSDS